MPIKVLPARLANQIAAGEVVERPASVLKELLENSIDSGATQITIDVEKGGHKKIKVTDNGSGIDKDELMLALSRHATSKVAELEDLEHIATLGFRGEALASISSVSRLTLTSRTEQQSEAWQARSEGRDMQVIVEPAAHPKGTSVEVLDLFFNTPARRKFLRTEKTEFNHIETLFTRIALSRFDVGMKLLHNGKLVKSLPAITAEDEQIKRIQQIVGNSVSQDFLYLDSQYQQFRLLGWVSKPGAFRSVNDTQYVFVNNRMMRDKLILHAIRQAFEGQLPPDKFPFFVLYLTLPHHEVDVNVHPAKHEVRFHQARLVHDFIYSAVSDAMNAEDLQLARPTAPEQGNEFTQPAAPSALTSQPSARRHNYQPDSEYIKPLQNTTSRSSGYHGGYSSNSGAAINEAASNYSQLMHPSPSHAVSEEKGTLSKVKQEAAGFEVPGCGWLVRKEEQVYFVPEQKVLSDYLQSRYLKDGPISQPLLLPVSVENKQQLDATALCECASKLGMQLEPYQNKLILKQVPVGARNQRWQDIMLAITATEQCTLDILLDCLARYWQLDEQMNKQALFELWMKQQSAEIFTEQGMVPVPLHTWLQEFNGN